MTPAAASIPAIAKVPLNYQTQVGSTELTRSSAPFQKHKPVFGPFQSLSGRGLGVRPSEGSFVLRGKFNFPEDTFEKLRFD